MTSIDRTAPARRLGMIAALLAAAGCADFSSPADPTGGLPDVLVAHPSLVTDIQPMLTKRCAQGGCHTPASRQGNMDLSAGATYSNTVNVTAVFGAPLQRVLPGSASASYLWRVIQPDTSIHTGIPRMPLAAQPLTPNQIQTIANWIGDGAPNN